MNNVYEEPKHVVQELKEITNNASTLVQENIIEEKTIGDIKPITQETLQKDDIIKEAVKNLREELLKEIKPETKSIIEEKKIKIKEEKHEIIEIKKPEGKFYEQILELLN